MASLVMPPGRTAFDLGKLREGWCLVLWWWRRRKAGRQGAKGEVVGARTRRTGGRDRWMRGGEWHVGPGRRRSGGGGGGWLSSRERDVMRLAGLGGCYSVAWLAFLTNCYSSHPSAAADGNVEGGQGFKMIRFGLAWESKIFHAISQSWRIPYTTFA